MLEVVVTRLSKMNEFLLIGGQYGTSPLFLDAFSPAKLSATLSGHLGILRDVALSADSRVLVSASQDSTLQMWDPLTGVSVLLHF